MAREIYVTPAEGKIVRDPATGVPLSAGGEFKAPSQHWTRQARQKAVTISKAAPAAPRSNKAAKAD